MTDQQPVSHPLYKVTNVRQSTMYADGSPPQPSFLITFDVLGKPGFTVELPESDFTMDNAQAAVEDIAMRLAGALNLEGQTIQFDDEGRPIAPS